MRDLLIDQIDDGPAMMLQGGMNVGWVYGSAIGSVTSTSVRTNVEQWVIVPDYTAPLSTPEAPGIVFDRSSVSITSPDAFTAFAEDAWMLGSTYLLSSCTYLAALPTNP